MPATEKWIMISCFPGCHFTAEQWTFLQSKCFKCCKSINDESARKSHRLSRKDDHSKEHCKRCHNHLANNEKRDYHVLEIHPMYFDEALRARFPEALERRGGVL